MDNLTYRLYKLPNTVFSAKEIALILGETDSDLVKSRINYYVKKGELIALRKGIYSKANGYNPFELATKIYTPAYVSLETVLQAEGVVFQNTDTVQVISYQTREIVVDKRTFSYRKIKDEILINDLGLIKAVGYYIASKERAFLDTVYLYKDYYFDNLTEMDWQKVEEVLPIYQSKALEKRVKTYVRN